MTKKNLLTILITAAIAAAPLTSYANDTKDAALELYNQLVTQDKATATTYINEGVKTEEVIAELVNMDSEDNPYDGPLATAKGISGNIKTYESGKMEVTVNNPFKRADAEKLLDVMVSEIDKTLPAEATQKDKLDGIIKYIGSTFKYGKADDEEANKQNFVEAYNGNGKIVCDQYSALTYLLCYRYGIDCRIMRGTKHAFNLIRLDGEDKYTAYDLTMTSYHLPVKVGYIYLITGSYTIGAGADKYQRAYVELTNQVPYRLSITILDVIVAVLIITIIGILVKTFKAPRRRRSHGKARQRATKNKAFAR